MATDYLPEKHLKNDFDPVSACCPECRPSEKGLSICLNPSCKCHNATTSRASITPQIGHAPHHQESVHGKPLEEKYHCSNGAFRDKKCLHQESWEEKFVNRFGHGRTDFSSGTAVFKKDERTAELVAYIRSLLASTSQKIRADLVKKVNRVEVIDHTKSVEEGGGRAYVFWEKSAKVELSLQDNDRTLKIFITNTQV